MQTFVTLAFLFTLVWTLVDAQKLWQSWSEPREPSLGEKEVNITVVAGRSTLLQCHVHNLKDKTVSWIREKDLTVLAVDTVTYTADPRFTVKHVDGTDDWGLHIQGVSEEDMGSYDCQLNTHPKKSTKVHLRVISRHAAEASFFDMPVSDIGTLENHWSAILPDSEIPKDTPEGTVLLLRGATSKELDTEDSLQVTCIAYGKQVIADLSWASPPERFIGWTLDDVPVTSLFPEWKIHIEEVKNASMISSRLTIKTVTHADSGQLACVAPEATPVSFAFDVKEIKSQMQHYAGLSNSKRKFTDAHRHAHQLKSSTSNATEQQVPSDLIFLIVAFILLLNDRCHHLLPSSEEITVSFSMS